MSDDVIVKVETPEEGDTEIKTEETHAETVTDQAAKIVETAADIARETGVKSEELGVIFANLEGLRVRLDEIESLITRRLDAVDGMLSLINERAVDEIEEENEEMKEEIEDEKKEDTGLRVETIEEERISDDEPKPRAKRSRFFI